MRSPYLIFVAAFCLVFAAACAEDDDGGAAGAGGDGAGGAGGGGGAGGSVSVGEVGGEFRAFQALLSAMAGCDDPDLTGVPGSTIGSINTQCIIVMPPDLSAELTFENTGVDTWNVTGTQALEFEINTTVMGLDFVQVSVTTTSLTEYSGTGTGSVSVGGTLELDALDGAGGAGGMGGAGGSGGLEFNIDVPSLTGTVVCKTTNTLTAGDDCTVDMDCVPQGFPSIGQTCGLMEAGKCDPTDVSGDICELVGLGPSMGATCMIWPDDTQDFENSGCSLNLPFPNDPLARLWPDLNFFDVDGELNVRMGDGPTNANGWFITNTDGTQFLTLEGPVTVE